MAAGKALLSDGFATGPHTATTLFITVLRSQVHLDKFGFLLILLPICQPIGTLRRLPDTTVKPFLKRGSQFFSCFSLLMA